MPRLVVMGVSGAGKTTVGIALARRLHVPFVDGDDLHSTANVEKMRRGQPLDDNDRWSWLHNVGLRLEEAPSGIVVACSALKESYRRLIRAHCHDVMFIHLHGPEATLRARLTDRRGHHMPPTLLSSQLAILESLRPDEAGVEIEVDADQADVTHAALEWLAARWPTNLEH